MRPGREVPEEAIERAERSQEAPGHSHAGVSAEDGSQLAHLRQVHGVDVGDHLSPATQEGLHDRVHGSTKVTDD